MMRRHASGPAGAAGASVAIESECSEGAMFLIIFRVVPQQRIQVAGRIFKLPAE
jgi:hypothetical protein